MPLARFVCCPLMLCPYLAAVFALLFCAQVAASAASFHCLDRRTTLIVRPVEGSGEGPGVARASAGESEKRRRESRPAGRMRGGESMVKAKDSEGEEVGTLRACLNYVGGDREGVLRS